MKKDEGRVRSGRSRVHAGRPVIGVTLGDPGGIGPEIVTRFFTEWQPSRSRALVIGSPDAIKPWADRFGWSGPILGAPEEMNGVEETVSFNTYILDTGCRGEVPLGKNSRQGGEHAGRAVELACRLAEEGEIEAIVTAPISKEALMLAEYPYSGHTERLADFFNAPNCQMMMVYQQFRVVPLTRHLPISAVSELITGGRIETCLAMVNEALKGQFGVEEPNIAVSALNPHAGEGGFLGKEEAQRILPAINRARENGIRVEGPFAADSLFQSPPNERYDAYVTMYHDQGLIPFKMIARRRGVNVTIGLPIIRTSVDHGVAFDIAGKGRAETTSIEAAYKLAEAFVERIGRKKTAIG